VLVEVFVGGKWEKWPSATAYQLEANRYAVEIPGVRPNKQGRDYDGIRVRLDGVEVEQLVGVAVRDGVLHAEALL